jgi:hypothetical protein
MEESRGPEKKVSRTVLRTMAKMRKFMAKNRMGMQYMFTKMDVDDSGTLDSEEFYEGMVKYIKSTFSREDLIDIINFIDEDGNGEISFKELDSAIRATDKSRNDRLHSRKSKVRHIGFGVLNSREIEKRVGIASEQNYGLDKEKSLKTEMKNCRKSVSGFLRKSPMF